MPYWWPAEPGSHELSRQVTELQLRPENMTTDGDTEATTAGGIQYQEVGMWVGSGSYAPSCG